MSESTRATDEAAARVIVPQLFWHAAALEQLPETTIITDPDAAARALLSSFRLYRTDIVVAAPVDAVGWSVRCAANPSAPVSVIRQEHTNRHPLAQLPTPDAIDDTAVTNYVVRVVERLTAQMPAGRGVAISLPTAQSLAASLGSADVSAADAAIGAFLRAVGPVEPAAAIRSGEGERSGIATGLCSFFGIPLIEALEEETDEVSAPIGEEFAETRTARGRIVTTRTEIPAQTPPAAVAESIAALRAEVDRS